MKDGWEIKKLGEVIELISGQHIDSKNYNTESKGIGYLTGPSDFNKLYPSVTKWTEYPKRTAVKNDILLTVKGSGVGSINLMKDAELCISRQLMAIRCSAIDRKYLYAFLDSNFSHFQSLSNGAAIPGISRQDVLNLSIGMPPRGEQEKIVEVLDKAFAAIDQAKANIEQNIANAKELFQSKLNQIFSQKGEGWVETTLGDVYDVRDGTHDSPKYQNDGFPLITSKNLKNDVISFEKIKFISEDDYVSINKRSKVDIGDILFAMIGTIGNAVVITQEPIFSIKNVALFKVSAPNDSQFLKFYLDFATSRMNKEAKGTTQKFVGLGYLRKFPIPLPSPIVQKNMVSELSKIKSAANELESHYQTKLASLDELKKSILQKAFAGELT